MLQIGIIGMPNAGKSTLFNALTRAHAEVAPRPFTTISPNEAIVAVPDPRLDEVARLFGQERKVPTAIRFVDIAGLVRGAHKGEGLGNQFLGHIREVDAVVHVVRGFSDPSVSHVDGDVNPARDVQTVELELLMADLAAVERRMDKTRAKLRVKDREAEEEMSVLDRLRAHLQSSRDAREFVADDDHARKVLNDLFLLTGKPVLYVANGDEGVGSVGSVGGVGGITERVHGQGERVVALPVRLAAEIAELEGDEAELFARELGLEESVLDRVVRESFELLDLVTFYTAVGAEASAWAVPRHTPASIAAGKIHTDMERGFIRSEVLNYQHLMTAGSWHAAREAGHVEVRGRDYLVQDGDIMHIRFHVG